MRASNQCAGHSGGDGYDSCKTYDGYQWNHVVTVWRNFDVNTTYKLCGYSTGTCLGLSSTGAVQNEAYTGAADQTWSVLQVSNGVYKMINVSNGKALDVSGSSMVMNSYTGAASQNVKVNSLGSTSQFGRYNLIPSSGSAGFNSASSGTAPATTTNLSMDSAKWTIIPAGSIAASMFDPAHIYRLNPMSAPNSSVDVCNGTTTNGTCVQEYATWDADGEKFNILASGSNWKITMKLNNAKCFSPVGNGTANGTHIEIQDCNGSNNQAWSATNDGTTGSTTFKNVASGRCLDVTGGSAANGTRMELYDCNGGTNQKFQIE